jgi:alpha,alpha-trehalase
MRPPASSIAFAPLRRVDGYLPIEDHGLIGDGSTAALVGRDGRVSWLCIPHFDSEPLFCSILDHRRGGSFALTPVDLQEARQRYEPDTGVLVTELKAAGGVVRITDCLTFRAGSDLRVDVEAARGELLRSVRVLEGEVRLVVDVEPCGGADVVNLARIEHGRTHRDLAEVGPVDE